MCVCVCVCVCDNLFTHAVSSDGELYSVEL